MGRERGVGIERQRKRQRQGHVVVTSATVVGLGGRMG